MSSSFSSTTDEDESQSLLQSPGNGGGWWRSQDGSKVTAVADTLGPLDDSTVLLRLLEVGHCCMGNSGSNGIGGKTGEKEG